MSRLLPLLVGVLVVLAFLVGLAAGRPPRAHVVLTFDDPRIVEASGLVVTDGLFTTVNDSGDSGRVLTVDRAGRTVGVTTWAAPGADSSGANSSGADEPVDDEALAPLPRHHVLVGDIGDNLAERPTVTLLSVPVGRGDRTVTPTRYELTYPGGPVNAETLMVQPGTGRVLVVTKSFFGGTVLVAPRVLRSDRPNRLRPVGQALAVATDGAFFPDGRHFVVRDYDRAVVYSYPDVVPVGRFRLPHQPQGEGIAVDDRGRVFVSSEGVDSTVQRVLLPASLRPVVTPTVAGPRVRADPPAR